ncbi:hypothetical protein GCM10020220_031830 [Nonomuraea rubra]
MEGGLGRVLQQSAGTCPRSAHPLDHGPASAPGSRPGALSPSSRTAAAISRAALVVAERRLPTPARDEVHCRPVTHERRVRALDRVEDPRSGQLQGEPRSTAWSVASPDSSVTPYAP